MDTNERVIAQIVKEQVAIIGPLAIELANNVKGVKFSSAKDVEIDGNPKDVIKNLVKEYAKLFGEASIEACKDAVKSIRPPVPTEYIPEILQ